MASRKPVKPYAVDIVKAIRRDAQIAHRNKPTAIDLAEVTAIKPEIIIAPHGSSVEYGEEYLVFQMDPDTLVVGDTVVIGRTPTRQPIVLGKADGDNPDPFSGPKMKKFKSDFDKTQKNTKHIKPNVASKTLLPIDGNNHGDLRVVEEENSIHRWDGVAASWHVVASGGAATGNFVDESGDTMTGDLLMDPGTMITLPDPPVQPTDVVNKAYVDYLFSLVSGLGPLVPTITVNSNYSVLSTDDTILVDVTPGPVTITLPATHIAGKEYFIKDKFGGSAINNITVLSADGDTVDLLALFVMNVNYQGIMIVSDGTNWFIV